MAKFTDVEKACIKQLAKLFVEGKVHVTFRDIGMPAFGLLPGNYQNTLTMMEHYGFIGAVIHDTNEPFRLFVAQASVVLSAREILADEESKDMVESIKLTFRRHPTTAWAFCIVTSLGFLSVVIHNVMAVLQDFHVIGK